MQKIYLKYDEYTPPVECDYGFVKEMLYLGFLYPLKKKNYKMYYIMLLTEVAVSALIMTFIPFKLGILLTVAMLFLINLLFAANYNMIVIEDLLKKGYVPLDYTSSNILIKKGIYIAQISLDSPVSKTGLKIGDIITKIDNLELTKMSDLRRYIYTKKPGEEVTLTILRNNKEQQIKIKLSKK